MSQSTKKKKIDSVDVSSIFSLFFGDAKFLNMRAVNVSCR